MAALGIEKVYDRADAIGYGVRCTALEDHHTFLAIYESAEANTEPRRHWCFKASTRSQVVAFYDDGPPGLRVHYHPPISPPS